MDEVKLRMKIIGRLKDLIDKIENDEPLPEESEQDLQFLIQLDDQLEECLHPWYY